jgi:hypothetical protein
MVFILSAIGQQKLAKSHSFGTGAPDKGLPLLRDPNFGILDIGLLFYPSPEQQTTTTVACEMANKMCVFFLFLLFCCLCKSMLCTSDAHKC